MCDTGFHWKVCFLVYSGPICAPTRSVSFDSVSSQRDCDAALGLGVVMDQITGYHVEKGNWY
jgi:hypothetical protein